MKWSIRILFAAATLVGCLATTIKAGSPQDLLEPFNDLLPPWEGDGDVEITTIASTVSRATQTTKAVEVETTTIAAPLEIPVLSLEPLLPPAADEKSPFTAESAIKVAVSKNVAQTPVAAVAAAATTTIVHKTLEPKPTKKSYYQQQQKQQKQQQLLHKQLQHAVQYRNYQPPAFVTRPPKGALPTLTPFPRHLKRSAV